MERMDPAEDEFRNKNLFCTHCGHPFSSWNNVLQLHVQRFHASATNAAEIRKLAQHDSIAKPWCTNLFDWINGADPKVEGINVNFDEMMRRLYAAHLKYKAAQREQYAAVTKIPNPQSVLNLSEYIHTGTVAELRERIMTESKHLLYQTANQRTLLSGDDEVGDMNPRNTTLANKLGAVLWMMSRGVNICMDLFGEGDFFTSQSQNFVDWCEKKQGIEPDLVCGSNLKAQFLFLDCMAKFASFDFQDCDWLIRNWQHVKGYNLRLVKTMFTNKKTKKEHQINRDLLQIAAFVAESAFSAQNTALPVKCATGLRATDPEVYHILERQVFPILLESHKARQVLGDGVKNFCKGVTLLRSVQYTQLSILPKLLKGHSPIEWEIPLQELSDQKPSSKDAPKKDMTLIQSVTSLANDNPSLSDQIQNIAIFEDWSEQLQARMKHVNLDRQMPSQYQQAIAVITLRQFFSSKRVLWQIPTGQGKSRITLAVIFFFSLVYPKGKIHLFFTHSKLKDRDMHYIAQLTKSLQIEIMSYVGQIPASFVINPEELLIMDECDVATLDDPQHFLAVFPKVKDAYLLFLTATCSSLSAIESSSETCEDRFIRNLDFSIFQQRSLSDEVECTEILDLTSKQVRSASICKWIVGQIKKSPVLIFVPDRLQYGIHQEKTFREVVMFAYEKCIAAIEQPDSEDKETKIKECMKQLPPYAQCNFDEAKETCEAQQHILEQHLAIQRQNARKDETDVDGNVLPQINFFDDLNFYCMQQYQKEITHIDQVSTSTLQNAHQKTISIFDPQKEYYPCYLITEKTCRGFDLRTDGVQNLPINLLVATSFSSLREKKQCIGRVGRYYTSGTFSKFNEDLVDVGQSIAFNYLESLTEKDFIGTQCITSPFVGKKMTDLVPKSPIVKPPPQSPSLSPRSLQFQHNPVDLSQQQQHNPFQYQFQFPQPNQVDPSQQQQSLPQQFTPPQCWPSYPPTQHQIFQQLSPSRMYMQAPQYPQQHQKMAQHERELSDLLQKQQRELKQEELYQQMANKSISEEELDALIKRLRKK